MIAGLAVLACLVLASAAQAAPKGFFGIGPQTPVTEADAQYMAAGGIESIRMPVSWAAIQPSPYSGYEWGTLDTAIAVGARAGLSVLPFLYGTPHWLEGRETTLPVGDRLERDAWAGFVRAAVERYGPHGAFWVEHGPSSADPLPEVAIRVWQIWNEVNFHYFAFPVSSSRYAKLLELTAPVIRSVDPGGKVLLSGLFGKPDHGGRYGMSAAKFLGKLYRKRGLRDDFDAIALHPYAFSLSALKRMVEGVRRVTRVNHDNPPLYITEMGWGSQNDPDVVAFEQGPRGQSRALSGAYRYLLGNRGRLHLRGVYWFSWKDASGLCSFCDSVGLFKAGTGFRAKPAWNAFVSITGGRPRP